MYKRNIVFFIDIYVLKLIVYRIVMNNKSSELTRLDWVGIRLNQFEMFEEHENCLSIWKQWGFKFETVLNENHV